MTTGWITSKLFKLMRDAKTNITECKITAENFAELITILYTNQINSSAGQIVLEEMFKMGYDPTQVIDEQNLLQESDDDKLGAIVDQVIADNPDAVDSFKAGKETIIRFLIGQVMKATRGKANQQLTERLLRDQLISDD